MKQARKREERKTRGFREIPEFAYALPLAVVSDPI
jgi:hypothetical protein